MLCNFDFPRTVVGEGRDPVVLIANRTVKVIPSEILGIEYISLSVKCPYVFLDTGLSRYED